MVKRLKGLIGLLPTSKPRPRSIILKFEDWWEPHILDRVRLSKIKPGQCRWPYGDMAELNFAFCGRPIYVFSDSENNLRRSSYCEGHYRRAHIVKSSKKVGE